MSTLFKSFLTGTLLTVGLVVAGAGLASAAKMTGTLTADNHYSLYTGIKNGSKLNFVGRNEVGLNGSKGRYNWSHAETWTFNINSGDYIYNVVWDDAAVAESWIGEFKLPDGKTLLSKAKDWEYVIAKGKNPGDYGAVPALQELKSEIANAHWIRAKEIGLNGINPWGKIKEVSANASFLNVSNQKSSHYTIFRTKYAAYKSVPEPTATPKKRRRKG